MTQADKAAGHVSALIEGANTAFNNFKTDHASEIAALNKFAADTAAPQACTAGAPVHAQTGIEPVRLSLFDASKDLLQWIETAHRPPKHDDFGTMALVRVDALATLADAVADEELRRAAPVAAGGENASIAEEGLAAAGAEPVVAPDPFRAAARQAVMWQARADLAQAVDAPARPTAAQQADISRHQAAIDRAAAAMAAESAEMVADAERSVAARASAPIVSKLVVEVDTTQLDAALAKAEQLKVLLAGLAPRVVLS